jgi:acetyl-CoA C-acetyltransferase
MDRDETIRPDSTPSSLAGLKPAFKKDGSVTAGNAPGVNDGAAAVVVMSEERAASLGCAPMARIAGYATSGLAPKLLLMTPVESITKLLKKIGWTLADVDLFEINEAFAAQMLAIVKELGLDPARLNVHGGAIALGHPIGASGARVLVTLLHAMRQRGAKRGVAALCLGGGNGVAMAIERNSP